MISCEDCYRHGSTLALFGKVSLHLASADEATAVFFIGSFKAES